MTGRAFDAIQLGVHARQQAAQRGISTRSIEHVLQRWTKRYPGTHPDTFGVEGEDESGRLIAIVYSELFDSRGRVAYVVTVFPIRRYRDDAIVI